MYVQTYHSNVNAIKAIYNSVKACVRCLGKVSRCFDSLVGVKQGEPLSPVLFIVFLNDVTDELDNRLRSGADENKLLNESQFGFRENKSTIDCINILQAIVNRQLNKKNNKSNMDYFEDNSELIDQFQKFILLFADDILLLAETQAELQHMLNKLCIYCKKWNITVNTDKTKAMLFKLSIRPEKLNNYFDETLLESVRNFIYLSVNISSNGTFFQAQKHLSEQASKALFALRNLFDGKMLCIEDKIKLFDSLV